jgi:DNA polymerase III epsilon subunit-like protein
MRLVFLDCETGGLDPARHPMIQVAAVATTPDLVELDALECKIEFDIADADPEALKGNCFDPAVWAREAAPSRVVLSRLSAFLSRYADVEMISQRTGRPYYVAQVVGHNAATFDGPFLQAFYKRHDAFLPASYRVLCTVQRAQWHFLERPHLTPPTDFKLKTLCDCFGIPLEDAHDALADVRANVALYRALSAKEAVAA